MRVTLTALALAGMLLLSGCSATLLPYAREMGDMALLRTMGVDAGEGDYQVEVTVSTGKRAYGLQGESQPSLVLSAQRESLSAACLAMQGLSDSYVFYGYVDQLLLGEGLIKRSVWPVLDYFAQDAQLGLGVQLWVVRGGTAAQAVQAGGESGVENRLSTLQTDSEMGAAGASRTAGEVFSDLLERGSAYLPALRVQETDQEGQTALLEAGYAVLKDGILAGYLEGESAKGLELLVNQAPSDVLEVPPVPGTGGSAGHRLCPGVYAQDGEWTAHRCGPELLGNGRGGRGGGRTQPGGSGAGEAGGGQPSAAAYHSGSGAPPKLGRGLCRPGTAAGYG